MYCINLQGYIDVDAVEEYEKYPPTQISERQLSFKEKLSFGREEYKEGTQRETKHVLSCSSLQMLEGHPLEIWTTLMTWATSVTALTLFPSH